MEAAATATARSFSVINQWRGEHPRHPDPSIELSNTGRAEGQRLLEAIFERGMMLLIIATARGSSHQSAPRSIRYAEYAMAKAMRISCMVEVS